MLSELDPQGGVDPIKICIVFFRDLASVLALKLSMVFRRLLLAGFFPSQLCCADVVPIPKRAMFFLLVRKVDIVRPYHELEYVSACKELNVDIFVIGGDWGNKPHNIEVEEYLESMGKKIVQVVYNPRTSSTKIKQHVIAQFHKGRHIEITKINKIRLILLRMTLITFSMKLSQRRDKMNK